MTRRLALFTVLAVILLPVGAQRQFTDHDRIISLTDHIEQQEKHLDSVDAVAHRTEEALTAYGTEANGRLDKLENFENYTLTIGKWLLLGILTPSLVGIVGILMNMTIRRGQQKAENKADVAVVAATKTHDLVNSNMEEFKDFMKQQLELVRQELREEKQNKE